MILTVENRISNLSILDDTASTTEHDDKDGERYKKNMKVVECRSAKQKHIRRIFILQNSFSSNRKIALNKNTKAVHMPSILAMVWHVARQFNLEVNNFDHSSHLISFCSIEVHKMYIQVDG